LVIIILFSPRVWGTDTLVAEVPRHNKHDCQCDLASVYKNLGSKTRSSAIDFTKGDFYQYCSRPFGGSPTIPLEQPRPGDSFEGRYHHQGNTNLAANMGGIPDIQSVHGVNTVVSESAPVVNATTTFVSDAAVVIAAENHSKGPTLSLAKKSQVPNVEDIKTFLAKPIVIPFTGSSFGVSDTYSTFGTIYPMSFLLLQPQVSRKLDGFMGIRATMVFRIIFNGNRFQQGRYMMTWIPTGGELRGPKRIAFEQGHSSTKKQRSQLHRVEFDLNCDTEAELVVPFSSLINWYPIIQTSFQLTASGELGALNIFPYVPLSASSGSLTAPFKVYMHLEDVELFGAAVPQMGKRLTRVVKRNASEIEAKNANIGPVESTMSTLTNVSNALSVVPLLAPFAKPASWVFEALTGVAASFGWSKPLNLAPAMRVMRQNAPYMGSIDNEDYCLPLSLDVKNSVEPIPGLLMTDQDEMDFNALVTIPAWIQTFNWAGTATTGTTLTSFQVSPITGLNIIASDNLHHTPLSFVANFFKFWRGSICFRFKIVKTEFHSGRIVVDFCPANTSGVARTPSYGLSPYLARQIYDIRECNEFTVAVPYMSVSPYLPTNFQPGTRSWATGTLNVYVEDPLVAPATVSSSIDIIVEMYAGPDMEFAYPSGMSMTPYVGLTPQMGERMIRNDCQLDGAPLALYTPEDQIEASSKCVGERIRSFRSLLKAYQPMLPVAAETAAKYWLVKPFLVPVATSTTAQEYDADLYGSLHGLYLYVRGGVRIMFFDQDAATLPVQSGLVTVNRNIDNAANPSLIGSLATLTQSIQSLGANALKVLGANNSNQPVQVSVPQLSAYFGRLCNSQMYSKQTLPTNFTLDPSDPAYLGNVDVLTIGPTSNSATQTRTYVKYRAAADDCDFAGFISVMPMKYGSAI
jgi:hypothetical protein